MRLIQTLSKPVNSIWWDGGAKQIFEWTIEEYGWSDTIVRVGSWAANFWFNVKKGKTEKRTLANAMLKLRAITRLESTFEYAD